MARLNISAEELIRTSPDPGFAWAWLTANPDALDSDPERIITPVGRDLAMLLDLIERLGNRRSSLVSASIIQKILRVGCGKAEKLLGHLRDRNMVGPGNHLNQHQLLFDGSEVAEMRRRVRAMEAPRG